MTHHKRRNALGIDGFALSYSHRAKRTPMVSTLLQLSDVRYGEICSRPCIAIMF